MTETKWIDWHPKVGDVRPERYRSKLKSHDWSKAHYHGPKVITHVEANRIDYQIPAPEESVMKYWQPKYEPVVNGWTLADVPEKVRCDIDMNHGQSVVASVVGGVIFFGNGNILERDPSDCKVIRVIDPTPPGAMTLDKVPENVRCVYDVGMNVLMVGYRVGSDIVHSNGLVTGTRAYQVDVIHILDPLPDQAYTLETLPVGRVIEWRGSKFFLHGLIDPNGRFTHWSETGQVINGVHGPTSTDWTVTDYIMELKEAV